MSADVSYVVLMQRFSENDGASYLRKKGGTVDDPMEAWQAALKYGGERVAGELERRAAQIRAAMAAGQLPKY